MTPETIFKLANDVYSPFAMLAGMKLDVHTPLANGSLAAAEIARAIAVKDVDRLEVLLYALVRAGLLTVSDGNFANTASISPGSTRMPRILICWSARP